jgi:hypothetical protein
MKANAFMSESPEPPLVGKVQHVAARSGVPLEPFQGDTLSTPAQAGWSIPDIRRGFNEVDALAENSPEDRGSGSASNLEFRYLKSKTETNLSSYIMA